MKPAPFAYARPIDWSEAIQLVAAGARPGAGTQSLGPLLNLRLAQPDTIADLRHLPGYAGVAVEGGVVRIGAGTTHAAIEDGAVPMPCANPPSTWPSTIIGFTSLPPSSTIR